MSLNHLVQGSDQANLSLGCNALTAQKSLCVQRVYNSAGGAASPTAAQIVQGYVYNGASGTANLQLPNASDIITELAKYSIEPSAGLSLPDLIINVSDANNLTILAGTNFAIDGTVIVNNKCAVVKIVFVSATALQAFPVVSA